MQRMTVEYLPVDAVKPYAGNPRRNKRAVAGVAESIRRYGFVNPIVIDDCGEIICGHTRLLAAQKLHMSEVPCIRASGLTEDEIRAYRLADNKVAEKSTWDEEKLNVELGGIREDMLVFGFEQPQTEGVYQDAFDRGWKYDPAPKAGQLYLLGRHRLYVGDPTPEALDALMGGRKADMLIGKPSGIDRALLTSELFGVSEHLKGGASFYLWHEDADGMNVRGACRDAGLTVRQCLLWDCEQSTALLPQDGYTSVHKVGLYGWTDGSPHLWTSNRRQTTVLTYEAPADGESLSVPLTSYCMENNTRGMDAVLDPWCACGTTLVAAEQNGRIGYAVCPEARAEAILARFVRLTRDASLVRCAE